VQLAPGKTASLEIVLPEAMMPKVQVGDSIPAWWLDLDAGVWREDGVGVVQASMAEPGKLAWVAQVTHFTWWNCDAPWTNKNCFIVPVHAPDGNAIGTGQTVGAAGVSYQGTSIPAVTDASGKACVNIMLGGTVTVFVGPSAAPYASVMVTGSGPAGDCAGNGAACTVLDPPLTLPFNSVCTAGEQSACSSYSGPPGTLGVGICKAGTQTCNATGTGWTDCSQSEVLPRPESCATPDDDDCDGLVNEEGNDCTCTPGTTVPCYTGPTGTIGVGLCHGGSRTCASDGKGYGPCTGQVVPTAEVGCQCGDGTLDPRESCDDGNRMDGDACPATCLRSVKKIRMGGAHVCALLTDNRLKCWGGNDDGELGLGDTNDRGDEPSEMGDYLPAVDIGAGAMVTAIDAAGASSCVLLNGGRMKCWGLNSYGQLGLGDTNNRGDNPGEMGDNLPFIAP
jgi:cysteine-rich repeat protein